MTVNFTKGKFNLREKLKELERPSVDKLVTKDGNDVYIDTITGNTKLENIDTVISDTAVDIFVYDTSKDSDGGAWRKRTTHTSWYNETLGTSVRGSKKEFPAVAVIVCESNKLTIYDGDDPDLPMWMVFNTNRTGYTTAYMLWGTHHAVMKNGLLVTGSPRGTSYGNVLTHVNFISEVSALRTTTGIWYGKKTIAERNEEDQTNADASGTNPDGSEGFSDNSINDLAITVFPNSPIETETGLPRPTIAGATDYGVGVITDTGDVHIVNDNSGNRITNQVVFRGNTLTWNNTTNGTVQNKWNIDSLSADSYSDAGGVWRYNYSVNGGDTNTENTADVLYGQTRVFASDINDPLKFFVGSSSSYNNYQTGLSIFEDGVDRDTNYGGETIDDSMVAHITTHFNTGWKHGKTRALYLSDTSAVDISSSELITNGTFDSNVNNWTANTDNTITWASGGYADVYRGGSGSAQVAYQDITTEIGKTYVLSFDVISLPSNHAQVYVQSVGGGSLNVTIGYTTTTGRGWGGVFVADHTTTRIWLYAYPNVTVRYDNVSVREADLNRTPYGPYFNSTTSGNGLRMIGSITKTPVATGADLVSYSPADSSSYMITNEQSLSMIDWSTNWCMSFWCNTAGKMCIEQYNTSGYNNTVLLLSISQNEFAIRSKVGNWYQTVSSNRGNAGWHMYTAAYSSGNLKIYKDAKEVASYSGTPSNQDAYLILGANSYNNNSTYSVSTASTMALAKLSVIVPSVYQIEKMYEDEKMLFQENAKCTLYGTSDEVTALAYDEVTDRLHVGTSSGRSDFQGLRRINNTTTAVTTAISAHDEFIVEQ